MMAFRVESVSRYPHFSRSDKLIEFFGMGFAFRSGAVQVPLGKGPSGSGYEFISVELTRGQSTRVQFFVHFPRKSYAVLRGSTTVPVRAIYVSPKLLGGASPEELQEIRDALSDIALKVSANERSIDMLHGMLSDLSARLKELEEAIDELRGETNE